MDNDTADQVAWAFHPDRPRWEALRFPGDAAVWHNLGFTASDASTWIRWVVVPELAATLRRLGLTPEMGYEWASIDYWFNHPEEIADWRGVYRGPACDAYEWMAAGFTPSEAHDWVRTGIGPADCYAWREAGFAQEEVSQLKRCLVSLDRAIYWRGQGACTVSEIIGADRWEDIERIRAASDRARRERQQSARPRPTPRT